MASSATASTFDSPPKKFNWPEFWVLTATGIFGCLASLPMLYPILRDTPAQITQLGSVPVGVKVAIRIVQMCVFVGLFVALGVALCKRCGLGAPFIEAWLAGRQAVSRLSGILLPAISAGVLASVAVLVLDKYVFGGLPGLAQATSNLVNPPLWQGFLASFYGGITEELFMRFGLLTLFVWVLAKLSHTAEGMPTTAAFWAANLLVAVLFGVGHLPATATVIALTKVVVTRAIVLNGLAGLVFGYLYWKCGLESAMVAHFSADIVVHVIVPAWVLFKH